MTFLEQSLTLTSTFPPLGYAAFISPLPFPLFYVSWMSAPPLDNCYDFIGNFNQFRDEGDEEIRDLCSAFIWKMVRSENK